MNPAYLGILIPIMGIGTGLAAVIGAFKVKLQKLKLQEMAMSGGAEGDKRLTAMFADTQAEVARLRDRVAVLERLATDGDRKLADDIERLRRVDVRPPV